MFKRPIRRRLAVALLAAQLCAGVQVPLAQAAMLGTGEVLQAQQQQLDRQQLLAMLDDQGVRDKLAALGYEPTPLRTIEEFRSVARQDGAALRTRVQSLGPAAR